MWGISHPKRILKVTRLRILSFYKQGEDNDSDDCNVIENASGIAKDIPNDNFAKYKVNNQKVFSLWSICPNSILVKVDEKIW